MNASIRTSFVLIAVVIVLLTFAAPYMSRAQEGKSREGSDSGTPPESNSSEQLQDVFERIGVGSEMDATTDSERSWVDHVISPFKNTNESEEDPGDAKDTDLVDAQDIDDTENPTTGASDSLLEEQALPESTDTSISASSSTSENVVTRPIDDIDPNSTPSSTAPHVLTLDEYLARVRKTPHVEKEAFHTSLAERRRLAVAMRATLEAADQVAEFGLAGTQLLQNASLDTVVATMIADKERNAQEEKPSAESAGGTSPTTLVVTAEEPTDKIPSNFDAWRLVYIVQDSQGERIGWRHTSSGERTFAYVGQSLTFGNDVVSIVRLDSDHRGRYLVIEVDGEGRDVHLY